jgi:hypothetical protein
VALTEALPLVEKLQAEKALSSGQQDWPEMTRAALAKLQ